MVADRTHRISLSGALWQAYRPCPVRFQFGDGCDRDFLTTFVPRAGLCTGAAVIFDGGVNDGQLLDTMRAGCPAAAQPHIYGIEINPRTFAKTSAKYAEIDTVHVSHVGWSSTISTSSINTTGSSTVCIECVMCRFVLPVCDVSVDCRTASVASWGSGVERARSMEGKTSLCRGWSLAPRHTHL